MTERLGNFLVEVTDSPRGRALFIIIVGCLAGIVEFVIHRTIERVLQNEPLNSIVDSMTIAVVVAIISLIEVQAVHHRRRKVIEDMRIVRELNHHVRNALQIIQYASRFPEERQQVQIIDESVARIDATLKDLFPGMDDPSNPARK